MCLFKQQGRTLLLATAVAAIGAVGAWAQQNCADPGNPMTNCGVYTDSKIPADPVIGTQPQDVHVKLGRGETVPPLSVSARVSDGGTLSYQWYYLYNTGDDQCDPKSGTECGGIDPWIYIDGATGDSFFPDTSKIGTRLYRVVVTNTKDGKTASITSRTVEVLMEPLVIARYGQDTLAAVPIIEVSTQMMYVKSNGEEVLPLSVSAIAPDGGTLSYQWFIRVEGDHYEGWVPVAGATEDSFFPDTSIYGRKYYHVVVTNTKDEKTASITSRTVEVFVEPLSCGECRPSLVQTHDRLIPQTQTITEVAVLGPVTASMRGFTAGPNPVNKSGGAVVFFHQGKRLKEVALSVYDASGAFVKKAALRDNDAGGQSSRPVGSWDLTDSKGRPVPNGTYLVKGIIKTADGKSEKVSMVVGIR